MTGHPKSITPDALAQVTGGAMPTLIVGTNDVNWGAGTDGNDIVDLRGGNDSFHGVGGDDLVNGGDGDDSLIGGEGRDVLHGGAGDDLFVWMPGHGNDGVFGGHGTDTLVVQDLDMSLEALLACIVVEEGSPQPSLHQGQIDLTGVRGTLVIGEERITFEGLEALRQS